MARGSSPGFAVVVKLNDQFTRPIAGLNSKIGQTTSRLRAMATAPMRFARAAGAQLGRIGGAVRNVGASFVGLGRSLAGLFTPFLQLGALVGGIGLGAFIKSTISAGSELVRLSDKTGLTVESLQKLQYAAKQQNVSVESLNSGFAKFNKTLADASKPAKKMTEQQKLLTQALGYSMQQVRSRAINSEDAFLRLADAVARTTNPLDQVRLATTAMGKAGADMLPILKLGREGITAYGKELEELGGIMTTEMAYGAKLFGDQMTTIGAVLQGVGYEVVKVLLPAFNDAAKATVAWLKANREWLSTKISDGVKEFISVGKQVFNLIRNDIIPAVERLKPAFDAVSGVLGPTNTALLAFAAIFTPGLLAAVLGVGKALAGLALTLATNPIGAALLGIAAAGIAIYQNWEPIKGFFAGLWTDVTAGYERFKDAFEEGADTGNWSKMGDFFSDIMAAIDADMKQFLDEFTTFITDITPQPIIDLWNKLPAFFEGIWQDIVGWFEWAWSTIEPIVNFVSNAVNKVTEGIKAVAEKATGWLPDWLPGRGAKEPAPAAPTAAITAETAAPTAALPAPTPRPRPTARIEATPMPAPAAMPGADDAPRQLSEAGRTNVQAAGQQLDAARQALEAARQQQAAAAQMANSKVQVQVSFANAPEGMRTTSNASGNASVTLNTAYAGTRGAAAGAY